jgi:hypothetical protein
VSRRHTNDKLNFGEGFKPSEILSRDLLCGV